GGFLLERFSDLPNARKEGAKYRLLQIAPARGEPKASAASASSASAEQSEATSIPCENESGADELRMTPHDPRASAGHPQGIRVSAAAENMHKIKDFTNGGADNADNADDFDQPAIRQLTARVSIREIVLVPLGPPGDDLRDLT